jgi:hypothetical protein
MKRATQEQQLSYQAILPLSPQEIYNNLMEHYLVSARNVKVDSGTSYRSLSFNRGSAFYSACRLGNDLQRLHFINVEIKKVRNGQSLIKWTVKFLYRGFRLHANSVIQECEDIARQLKEFGRNTESHASWTQFAKH